MEFKNIDSVVLEFVDKLEQKLKHHKYDVGKIEEYIDAVKAAKKFCIEQFSGEFARFGGQFTSHGPDHAARVLQICIILSERLDPIINATEYFVLGLSAILHDIGMTATLPSDITEKIKDEDIRWIERRKRHGEATAEILTQQRYDPQLTVAAKPNQDIFYTFLPLICAAHCTDGFERNIAEIRKLKNQHFQRNRYELLAGILLLADELDVTCIRARPDINSYREFKSTLTKAHWWKHWFVSDVDIYGNTVYISCLDKSAYNGAEEFSLWTESKIQSQIALLKSVLDINAENRFWNIEVKLKIVYEVWWILNLPEMTTDIIDEAQKQRLKIPGQKMSRIIEPLKLIQAATDRNLTFGPSQFFRNAIAPRIDHYRGQNESVHLEQARLLYVENQKNMNLLKHAMGEWSDYVNGEKMGVKFKKFVGEIGIGKTHFLSTFLYEIKHKYPEIYDRVLLVRSEFTECDRDDILSVQRRVATSLFKDLKERLNISDIIREMMIRDYSVGIAPQIPKHLEEIQSWDTRRIEEFIIVVGKICRPESEFHKELVDKAPLALCLFCDNSDQLNKEIIGKLYEWSFNISGNANSLVWIFMRPDTLSYLETRFQNVHFDVRGAESIAAPTIKDVVEKRINTFPSRFKNNEKIEVGYGQAYISPQDVQKAVEYITNLTISTADSILGELTNHSKGDGQPNIRAGLFALLSILGSHIISDHEYSKALLYKESISGANQKRGASTPFFQQWAKIVEALILGRRKWYSPLNGSVENLLDPPEIGSHGDYFIIIHCLQVLAHNDSREYTYGELQNTLRRFGYIDGRIQQILKYLASREDFIDDHTPHDEVILKRIFPLVELNISLEFPVNDSTIIQITSWGRFHLNTLLDQAKYWKHIYYQIQFPLSFSKKLVFPNFGFGHYSETRHVDQSYNLGHQLNLVFDFLIEIESQWLYGNSLPEIKEIGISPIMVNIKRSVLKQLNY